MIRLSSFCTAVSWLGLACGGLCLGAAPVEVRPGSPIPILAGAQNLVPNASFECGTDGWGSAELDAMPGWYGPLNALFGRIDSTAAVEGRSSLRIELTPENQPIAYNDYLHVERRPIRAPLAANIGWLAVEPGKRYTFSVRMKAAEKGTPARLVLRQFRAAPFEKLVRLSTDWERYTLEFTPQAEACYVLAGPDLRKTEDNPAPPSRATVWLDAVQLAPADPRPPFATRQPVEFGMATDKPGNVFAWDEPLRFRLTAASADAKAARTAEFDFRLTDFFDEEVWREKLVLRLPAGASLTKDVLVPPSPQRHGFLRLHATMTSGADGGKGGSPIFAKTKNGTVPGMAVERRTMRLAAIPVYRGKDSRFGLNHAFAWPEQLVLSRQAGLLWMRDWSPKWQDVEPEKGRVTYVETDAQIDRLLKQELKVLGLMAFPSSMWSSSAPASVKPPTPWYASYSQWPDAERRREDVLAEMDAPYVRMSYAPRDLKEFEDYVTRTVTHYKGRIRDWHAFNEPIHTNYAFDGTRGYKTADLVRHLESFVGAARRADPQCRIMAGYNIEGYHPDKGLPACLAELERFIALGGLKQLDVFTLHTYPSLEPPEGIEPLLQRMNAVMDQHGCRRPIWFTEYAYYADDDPWCKPIIVHANGARLPSERVQAEYQVRWNTTLLANGVDKIFYHAGIGSAVNHGNLWTIMLRYGGEPFKCYTSQAVMAGLLTPECKFVKRLGPDEAVKAYLFSDTKRAVAVVWAPAGAKAKTVRLADARLQLWDIMGRPQAVRTFTPGESPVYVVGEGVSPEEFEKGLSR